MKREVRDIIESIGNLVVVINNTNCSAEEKEALRESVEKLSTAAMMLVIASNKN